MAPTKQAQIQEARRNNNSPIRQNTDQEVPSDPVADNAIPDNEAPVRPVRAEQPIEGEPRRQPIVQSPKDRAREDIVKSFRDQRNQQAEDENTDEISRFTRSGMPPELLELEEPEPQPDDNPPLEDGAEEPITDGEVAEEPEVVPVKHKLIIRGKELEVTEDELFALAQKAAAADDYLDEAKRKLKEVDELMRPLKAGRDSQTHTQSVDQNNANGHDNQQQPVDEHNVDPFEKVVETIQFGDLKEAAKLLREVSTNNVDTRKVASEELERERMRNEAIRSQKILKEFEGQHPDLAKDTYALAAMRTRLIELQTEDLKSLGLDEAVIPKTGDEIANWHMWYRQKGHGVRDVDVLLKTARDDFMKWKGVKEQPAAPTNKAAPRVEVTVDRQQRRAAIQQQPSRTVAPKPDAIAQPAPQKDRSSIVQDMIAARGRPRQKVAIQ